MKTKIPFTNCLAAMLRDFLDDHGLSQARLAADLHISQSCSMTFSPAALSLPSTA
ncbi:MAG: hypothetical protein ACK5JP_13020 [Akkermansiaceae bacterium]